MTQNPGNSLPSRSGYRPAADGSDDLDTLLDAIMADDPGPRQERADAVRQRSEQRMDETRLRLAERANDDLRSQIRALTLQVQTLSEASATQAAQGHAIQELREAVREAAVTAQTPPKGIPSSFNAEVQLPSLQIRLVLAQAAHLLHQADNEVTVFSSWSMLFRGVTLGAVLGIGFELTGPIGIRLWIYVAVALFALSVAMVFAALNRRARLRVASARKAMDESALTRTMTMG